MRFFNDVLRLTKGLAISPNIDEQFWANAGDIEGVWAGRVKIPSGLQLSPRPVSPHSPVLIGFLFPCYSEHAAARIDT